MVVFVSLRRDGTAGRTRAAQAFGLPLLPPYLQSKGKDLRRGVNFAVGGATAMDPPFFQEIGASDKLWTNLSLSVQLGWFEQLKPLLTKESVHIRFLIHIFAFAFGILQYKLFPFLLCIQKREDILLLSPE
jgi:hypothetical protein